MPITAGSLCLALAVLGVLLPPLPATHFLLLASACYVRGSEHPHRWPMGNRVLGTYIRNFRERRGIPLRAELVTVLVLWLSLLHSTYRLALPLLELLLLAMTGLASSALIVRVKTLKGDERSWPAAALPGAPRAKPRRRGLTTKRPFRILPVRVLDA